MSSRPPPLKLLYVINDYAFLITHRRYLVEQAVKEGHEVVIVAPEKDTLPGGVFLPVRRISWTLSRKGRNPLIEWSTFVQLLKILRAEKPDVVHAITIKPVIYCGLIARFRPFRLVASISGMGFTYISRKMRDRILRKMVNLLYRFALRSPRVSVIFQNEDDRSEFIRTGTVSESEAKLIPGVGVDLESFSTVRTYPATPVFTLPARLLSAKGVREFAEAARQLKPRYPAARFLLAGTLDLDNPHGIQQEEVDGWVSQGSLEWEGFRPDMLAVYSESSVIVLPSYREGFSKVLMEAAAAGRALVTSDVPGCREAVLPGENGFLVPCRDSAALVSVLEKFLNAPQLIEEMGEASRKYARLRFGREVLTRKVLDLYLSGPGA